MPITRILKMAPAFALLITFIAWTWLFDWESSRDWQKLGKALIPVACVSLLAALRICKQFHWTAALFYLYVMLQWVYMRMAPVSIEEVAMLNATFFAAIFICQENRLELLGRFLAVDAIAQSTLGLVEVAGYFPYHELTVGHVWAPLGSLGNPTLLGPYVAVCLPFLVTHQILPRFPKADLALRGYGLVVSALLILFSRSTMAAGTLATVLIIGAGFYFGRRVMAKALCVASLTAVIICLAKPDFASLTGRMEPWTFAYQNLTLTGYGSGTWMPIQWRLWQRQQLAFEEGKGLDPSNQVWGQAHNDPLQGHFEWGHLGMAPLYVGAFLLFLKMMTAIACRRKQLFPWCAMFFGLLACSFGSYVLHVMPMGALFVIAACAIFRYDFEADLVKAQIEGIHWP